MKDFLAKFFSNRKTNRYVSFTFDDGFIAGAQRVAEIISPHKATFYIVTSWLRSEEKETVDKDHGKKEEWQRLSDQGHEIGSHSASHPMPEIANRAEYQQSLEIIKLFHPGPYSLAMPYGLKSFYKLPYDSIRFCEGKKIYNPLTDLDFTKLTSFDPVGMGLTIEKTLKLIHKLPSNSWLILRGHSLDQEGFCPWSEKYLEEIYRFLLAENFEIKTIRDMTIKFK